MIKLKTWSIFCASVQTVQIFKLFFYKEVKIERKRNCSRAQRMLKKCAKIRIFSQLNYHDVKMVQSEMRKPRISVLRFSKPTECRTRMFKYRLNICTVCGTTVVLKQGTLYVPSMPQRYITYVRGTLWVGAKLPMCPAAVLFPIYFTSCE